MSNIDKRALLEAAEKATALNLDTAQLKRRDNGFCECPVCFGEGYVDVESDYCNIDGVALGVLFYGMGKHRGLAEEYFRAANPATVLALLDELEAKDKRIAELEAREVKLPKPISVLYRRDFADAHRSIYAYPEAEVNAALSDAGIRIHGED